MEKQRTKNTSKKTNSNHRSSQTKSDGLLVNEKINFELTNNDSSDIIATEEWENWKDFE